ncbi:MAG: hypothetical protein AB1627_16170 [Chloroflexota bacterium]
MADDLDARLEARLAEALRLEADSLPLLVRDHDLTAALRRRQVRRFGAPAALVAATAVVLLLVGGGAAMLGLGGAPAPSPSPSPTLQPLASYEELHELVGAGAPVLLRGELVEAGPEAAEADLGTLPMADSLAVGVSCLGGSIDLVVVRGSTVVGTSQAGCSLRPYVMQIPTRAPQGSALFDGTEHLIVRSPVGVRWRIVIADGGPGPSVRVVTPSPIPLAGYDELVALLREQRAALDALLEAERIAEDEPGGIVTTDIGAVGPHDALTFALSCSGGWIEIRVMSGDEQVFGSRSACEGSPTLIADGVGSTDLEHRVLVVVPLETSWRVVVG